MLEIFLRLAVLSLRLARETALGKNQRIVIVEGDALIEICDRELGVADY